MDETTTTERGNDHLRYERELRGWSLEAVARRIKELDPSAGASADMIGTWERGEHSPRPFYKELLCRLYNTTADRLGFIIKDDARHKVQGTNGLIVVNEQQAALVVALQDWLAHLRGGKTMAYIDASRRAVLIQGFQQLLGVAGASLMLPHLLDGEPLQNAAKIDESSLREFARLTEVCWQLSRGNQLGVAQQLLPAFLPQLEQFAKEPSKHQQVAANLVTQGYRLAGILALHQNNLTAREIYCKQAVQYSQVANDQSLHVAALKGLADTFYYGNRPMEVLQTYQQAEQHIKQTAPLLCARVFMGLAVAHAQYGDILKQEALRYLGLAQATFPERPEDDPSFAYADFDRYQMILWEGLVRFHLGEAKNALQAFALVDGTTKTAAPTRILVEITNHKAKTAIALRDLELSTIFVEAGAKGARALGSQRRYNEAQEAFALMQIIWPHEKQVKDLTDIFSERVA